ncbi:hypothetical protein TOPH_03146 [Tolypocladium ophioglossoides CBS 100239]|uniref:Uncharacterized protein n=1 Tax=Tolypocladium ophioglossoides (strain CBS 100239) TaxID=1163406 RepID=A0A0L0NDV0_TOLOC|nr:hypothetical protein TOPH_03146 [Tolypocladium ophioglossoides CBS 100239]
MASTHPDTIQPGQPPPQACSQCKGVRKTFICIQCNNFAFCDECWPKWVLHGDGATGYNGKPHEKSDPKVMERLRRTLDPSVSEAEKDRQLEVDDETTWFGVVRDAAQRESLHDHGRFTMLMSESSDSGQQTGQQYPQLVSFIGQTGK